MTTKREQLVNNARTALSSSVSIGATSISVSSASGFPTDGNFRILVDSEIMQVTAVSGTTFTVVRGVEATSDAAHNSGAAVFAITTAGALRQIVSDDLLYANHKPLYHSITSETGAQLQVSDFTWLNQSTATAQDIEDTIYMRIPANAGIAKRGLLRSAPATPYTVTVGVRLALFNDSTGTDGYPQFNLGYRDSGTSRMVCFFVALRAGSMLLGVHNMTTETSWSADQFTPFQMTLPEDVWVRTTDNGTNHLWDISHDGKNWIQFHSATRTTWTANPNQTFIGMDTYQTGQSPGQRCTIFHHSIS